MSPLLEITDLVKAFRGVRAVDGASFAVQPGSITGLIGPNGSGKSTAIDCISGFQRADAGRVRLDGNAIDGLAPQRIARSGLTRTFQDVRVYDTYTVLENLLVVAKPFAMTNWADAFLRTQKFRETHRQAETRALDLIGLVGLTRLTHAPALILSYGQKKLLAFAAAMMSNPSIVVLDEPVAGVNPTRVNEVVEIVRAANRGGTTFLIIEHNVDFITSLCDHVIVFDRGRKLTEGPSAQVHRDPLVLDAYLGVEPGHEPHLARAG
jgi:ABC-type branched-subunit amino acid transport system ATPase component